MWMYEVASARVSVTAFELVQHLVTIPVSVNGIDTRFVLDSGIGVTIVSQALCERAGCARTATSYTGRRMSGQAVTVELARATLTFGGLERTGAEVGVLDLSGFPPALAGIEGFLSLAFFDEAPFTVDYAGGTVELDGRGPGGTPVDVRIERDGPSVTAFLPLVIPGGRTISAEVDMGSDVLILDERLAEEVGAELGAPEARRAEGVDETGNPFVRTFMPIAGSVEPAGAPRLRQSAPQVQFQRIIHDGLVGHDFLRRFAVTWDVAAAQLLFAPPG
jgi:hypothetical protein